MFNWLRRTVDRIEPSPEPAGPTEYDDAVKWFRKAAEKGTSWGQLNLGISYLRGQGVTQDYTEAMKWFLMAAEQGEAMSQYSLGQMHAEGLGIGVDYLEAYKWFHLAAGHGIRDAQMALDHLGQILDVDQIAEGQRRAAAFVPRRSLSLPNSPTQKLASE